MLYCIIVLLYGSETGNTYCTMAGCSSRKVVRINNLSMEVHLPFQ